MARLDGKVILISGGARGQGAAEARLCVAEGARVVIGDVLETEGRRLASELGNVAVFVRQDVTLESDWQKAIDAAETFGGLHGLVNNAGIYQPSTLMETDTELFERHMRINQLGCFLGMKCVVPLMERSGGGSIVNISSVAGLRGSPGAIAYSATKWALRGMTKAAANRSGPAQDTGELGASRPNRHRNAEGAYAGAESASRPAGADEAHGHRRGGCQPGAVPAVGRERLHHRRRGRDRRWCNIMRHRPRALAPPHPFAHVRTRWIGTLAAYPAEPSSCSWGLIMKD
jgi:short subunit dehydrogenase